jgi:hypothetical protein
MEEALVEFMRKHEATFRQADDRRHQRGARRPLLVASVPLDLAGLPSHYPTGAMASKMPSVTVRVFAYRPGDPAGSWIYWPAMMRGINLYVSSRTKPDDARPTLQHELRHMVQSLLWDALGTGRSGKRKPSDYGAPAGRWDEASARLETEIDDLEEEGSRLGSRSPRGQEIAKRLRYLKAEHGPRYFLDPAEYFPHLGNTKDALLGLRGSGASSADGPKGAITPEHFRSITERSDFLRTLRTFAPDLHRKALGDLRAWADAHNAEIRAAANRRPITTSRILSDLQDRFDSEDPALAAELRLNRDRYEALARSLATR